jgi:hypothetical protein
LVSICHVFIGLFWDPVANIIPRELTLWARPPNIVSAKIFAYTVVGMRQEYRSIAINSRSRRKPCTQFPGISGHNLTILIWHKTSSSITHVMSIFIFDRATEMVRYTCVTNTHQWNQCVLKHREWDVVIVAIFGHVIQPRCYSSRPGSSRPSS